MRFFWDWTSGIVMGVLGAIPLTGVRVLIIALLASLALWALFLPADYAFKGSPSRSPWRDVRIWAAVVIILEIIPYIVF